MNKDFDSTPSFYNNEDAFKKYLKQTSFYIDLQNYLIKLIKFSKSKNILELGSATGDTSIKVAKHFPECHVHGIDIRENIVEVATKSASIQEIKNISFSVNDMVKFVKNNLDYDFVYMLYAFHHIEDPLKNKVNFLTDLYKNLKKVHLSASQKLLSQKMQKICMMKKQY